MISPHGFDVIKVVTGSISALGLVVGGLKWVASMFKKMTEINNTVKLLATNHLPHIQDSLDAHTNALQSIKSDVRVLGSQLANHETRFEDTREELKIVHASFLKHLEDDSNRKRRK